MEQARAHAGDGSRPTRDDALSSDDALSADEALAIIAAVWSCVRQDLSGPDATARQRAWAWCHGPHFRVWVAYVTPGADLDVIRDQLLRQCWRVGVPRPTAADLTATHRQRRPPSPLVVTPAAPPSTTSGPTPYAVSRSRAAPPAPTA